MNLNIYANYKKNHLFFEFRFQILVIILWNLQHWQSDTKKGGYAGDISTDVRVQGYSLSKLNEGLNKNRTTYDLKTKSLIHHQFSQTKQRCPNRRNEVGFAGALETKEENFSFRRKKKMQTLQLQLSRM